MGAKPMGLDPLFHLREVGTIANHHQAQVWRRAPCDRQRIDQQGYALFGNQTAGVKRIGGVAAERGSWSAPASDCPRTINAFGPPRDDRRFWCSALKVIAR